MPRHHKMMQRLFIDAPLSAGARVELGRDQVNYLVNVLRMAVGDEVIVFNGRDGAWRARLETATRKSAGIVLAEQVAPQPARLDLWYGFAPLKSARLDYMVQKAVEMGVGALQPVITQHTQVTRLKPDRMRANAIEAAEQCEVLCVPELLPEIKLPGLVSGWKQQHGDRMLLVADEEEASASPITALEALKDHRVGLLIGPEGGFSDEERALLRRQDFVATFSLGPRILRADTAAIAALALIQSIIGDWR